MALKGILFDKDGTLVDFEATWVPALISSAHALAALAGCPDRADAMLDASGRDPETGRIRAGSLLAAATTLELMRVWRDIAPALPPVEEAARWLDEYWARESDRSFTPVCDMPPLFADLRGRGCHLGIATNDSEAAALHSVRRMAIETHVSFVAGYDSGHGAKPEPGMLRAFCREHNLLPSDVAMVGDSEHDMRAGRAAGYGLLVGVLTGASGAEDLEPHADVILPDITALPELL